MNIVELGAIGELVGGVAVIGSLVFVGMQLRESNQRAKDAAALALTDQFDRYFQMIISDAKAREMFIIASGGGAESLGMANPSNLNSDDLTIFGFVLARSWHQFENQHRAWQAGTLEEQQWSKVLPFMHQHLNGEPGRQYWSLARQGFHGSNFTEFVDAEIARFEGAGG